MKSIGPLKVLSLEVLQMNMKLFGSFTRTWEIGIRRDLIWKIPDSASLNKVVLLETANNNGYIPAVI